MLNSTTVLLSKLQVSKALCVSIMNENQISKTLSGIAGGASLYIAFLMLFNMGSVYSNAVAWSGSEFQATLFSIFVAASVVSAGAISILIYFKSRSCFLMLLLAHVLFVVVSWPAFMLLLAVLIWWFSKYTYAHT